jgi:hypothetical protein
LGVGTFLRHAGDHVRAGMPGLPAVFQGPVPGYTPKVWTAPLSPIQIGDQRFLPAAVCVPHALAMFVVSEAEAAAIPSAFDRGGELSAAGELRRLFPGITDNVQARECARTIAGWKPLAVAPPRPTPRGRGCSRYRGSAPGNHRQPSRMRPVKLDHFFHAP